MSMDKLGSISFEFKDMTLTAEEGETMGHDNKECVYVSIRRTPEEEMVVFCLTPWQARKLADSLKDFASEIENRTIEKA